MFKELIRIQRRKIEQEKAVLEKGRKIVAKLCKFRGAVHWVVGAAHRAGVVHWATLHSAKNTLAGRIEQERRVGFVARHIELQARFHP